MRNCPINLLLIKENSLDYSLIGEMLNEIKKFSFNLQKADRLSIGLACLAEGEIDLVLLDLFLPDSRGLATFDRVFAQAPEVPIIIIASSEDEKLALQAVEKGAQDYLFKGQIDVNLLNRAIGCAIERKRLEMELKKINIKLQQEIIEHKKTQKELKDSLREKLILLKEIHHRVRNNLQFVCSLLFLQKKYTNDKKNSRIFEDFLDRIKSMALVHEKLLESKSLVNINFAEYIKNLADTLFKKFGISDKIALFIDVEELIFGIESAVPCGLVLNELISNSLKHAFPGGRKGEIHLNLFKDKDIDDRITLMVNDNGLGFPKGLDFRNTESLGLKLINFLVLQLNGTIELDQSEGTTFTISFRQISPSLPTTL